MMMTVIASYAKRLCQDGETDRRVIAWTDGNEFAKHHGCLPEVSEVIAGGLQSGVDRHPAALPSSRLVATSADL